MFQTQPLKQRKYILTAFHFFSIVAMALLINTTVYYLTNEFCLEFMRWFDEEKPLMKFSIITLTSVSLMGVLLIVSYPMQWLRNLILGWLPMNRLLEKTYYYVLLVNLICGIIYAWITLPSSNYWNFVEMLLISMILIQLNWFFLYESEERPGRQDQTSFLKQSDKASSQARGTIP